MKGKAADKIRNFVLAGDAGCGKTSLADLLLFKGGVVSRQGSVDDGTSVSDYRDEERERKASMYAAPLNCPWKDSHFFFIDTPGYVDFFGETLSSIAVADMVVIVIDAASGIDMGTIKVWRAARDRGIPRAFFINGCDRDQADYAGVLAKIQQNYGATVCIPFTVPVGEKTNFSGVIPVLGDDPSTEEHRLALMDTIAESDEKLMEKYLEEGELSPQEIASGLSASLLSGDVVPVFAGSAATGVGVEEFMDAVASCFPSPVAGRAVPLKKGEFICDKPQGDGKGFVFKSVNDPFVGQLTFCRVYAGVFSSDHEITNSTNGNKERMGSMMLVNGKDQQTVSEAGPGEIIAIAKLKSTHLGDTLCGKGDSDEFLPTKYPTPTMHAAVFPVKSGEDEKIATGLIRISEEDPTVRLERDPETAETVLSCMGDQHQNNIIARLKEMFKVECELKTPKVPYRETIQGSGTATYRHKKQTGGHGQFAEVHLRVDCTPDADFEFGNEVVGGNIPKNYIPAVEKGVREAMAKGPLAGCKVINLKATVFDGKYHPVDSSEMAFKIASRAAFRDAMKSAKPQLLEPIMSVRVFFPEEYMGDISGDLNSRRGRILGMDREEGLQVVKAEIPLAEVYNYPTTLRSITHGRGTFESEFARYEPVPANIAKEIEAAAEHEHDED
ncbi:MAG: elongation factor G [Lentisphaeria bacterium]|nr:elongation factor G [Lentisphaeria bacterium]